MLKDLLNDLKNLETSSSSSIIKDLVSQAENENASKDLKDQIIGYAKKSNLEFLIPSNWFGKAEIVESIKLSYSPLSEIEDTIELVLASDVITVGNELEKKVIDCSTINKSSYQEIDGQLVFDTSEDVRLLDLIAYCLDAVKREGKVTVSNGTTEIVLDPDEAPDFYSLKELHEKLPLEKAIDNSFETLLLPFGDNFVSNKRLIIEVQEKLAPFGAIVGFLQCGDITINLDAKFVKIIEPILELLQLKIIEVQILKDNSALVVVRKENLIIETSFDFDKIAKDLNL